MEEGEVNTETAQVLAVRLVGSDYLFCLPNMWRTEKWLCVIVDPNEVHGCVGWMRAANWYVYPGELPPMFEPVPQHLVQGGVPVWAKIQISEEEAAFLPPTRNDGQHVIGLPKIDYDANEFRARLLEPPQVEEMP